MSAAPPAPVASINPAPGTAWTGLRIFAGAADEQRGRRAYDVIVVVVGTVLLGATSASAVPVPGFVRALTNLLATLPSIVAEVGELVADTLAVLALATLIAAFARGRRAVARDVVLALLIATVTWLLLGRSIEGEWPAAWRAVSDSGPPPWYPSPRLALSGSMLLVALPHLTLPLRRLVWWGLAFGTAAVAVAGGATPLGAVAGLLIAMVASSVVLLLFGSSGGRPSLEQVAAALDELGVAVTELGVADRQEAGYFLVAATAHDGSALTVKVYGRDAHDAAVLSTLWRTVWYREAGAPLRFRRLQQVEYEAFMTLFAAQAGVATDTVVVAGATEAEDALLVLRPGGEPLTRAGADATWVVPAVWNLVDRLHRHGITHGQLDTQHIIVTDDDLLGVDDLRGAAIDRSEARVRTDEAQALVTTALLAGPDVAVATAIDAIGPERLAAVLPYLQPPTLTTSQRQCLARRSALDALDPGDAADAPEPARDWIAGDDLDLSALRTAAAAAAGVEAPELRQLRRVTVGSVLRLALPAIALLVLVSALAGLDFAELIEQLGDASWWLVALGLLVAQTPRFTQAISTLGASPTPLPLGPVYALQLAISYINVAIPSTAARVAVNVRFFQRHGVPPGSALAAGALDGFGGLIVQAFLLLTLLLFTSMSLDIDLSNASTAAARLAVLVVVIVVIAVGVIAVVRPLRRFVVTWVVRLAREAWTTVRGLRSMRRLALLLGGNLGSEILFASALGVFARALGYPIGLGDLLFINISVGLLSALIPVPGGVGVAEGGLTLGLARAGMPEGVAFAAVLLYRMATFYLPPTWGYVAMRWLERNNHL